MNILKNSGIEWIGNIPSEWEINKIKNVANVYTGNSISDDDKGLYSDKDDAFPYIATKDINIIDNTIDYENGMYTKIKDKKFKIAHTGDTLLCIEGGNAGKKIARLNQNVSFVNKLCCFNPKTIDSNYLYYSIMSDSFTEPFKQNIFGLIGGVSQSVIRQFNICIPNVKEQKLIADFLDEKVGIINSIICDLNDQIEILYKYKKQIITESVTTGLNKNVNFKDSGIDWMEKIPKHWIVKPLKYMFYMYAGGDVNEYDFSDIKEENYIYPIYSNSLENKGLFGFTSKYRFSGKTFTVTGRGDIGYAIPRFDKYYPIVRLLVCVPKNGDDNRYYSYCVNSANVIGDQTAMAQLTTQRLGMVKVPYPPLEEQKIIANYLDKKCSEIDEILNSKMKQKEQMEQYKKSVIYEYVTGKKRVEGAEELYG